MNVRRIPGILKILLLTVLVGALGPGPARAQSVVEYSLMVGLNPFVVINLSNNVLNDSQLAVTEGAAVWVSDEGTDSEILLYDLSSGPGSSPQNISNNAIEDAAPQVESSRVVWQSYETTALAAYSCDLADPAAGATRLTDDYHYAINPQTDGDWVAWTEYEGESETAVIYYSDLSGEPDLRALSTEIGWIEAESLRLQNNRVVTAVYDGDLEICYADLTEDGEVGPELRRLTNNDIDDLTPSVKGDQVIWVGEEWVGEEKVSEMYYADLSSGEEPEVGHLPYTPIEDSSPLIEGDRVIYVGHDGDDTEIYCYYLSDGDVRQLTDNQIDDLDPQIVEDRVVWCGTDSGSDSEIYYYDLSWDPETTPVRLTDNELDDISPLIAGRQVVWIRYMEDGTTEIFAASPVNTYAFTCYYNDEGGDYFSGYFYDSQIYAEDDIVLAFLDENGDHGYYQITGILEPDSEAVIGQVFVDTYYDSESDTFQPIATDNPVGLDFLGSEDAYILTEGVEEYRFGGAASAYYEADLVSYACEFTCTYSNGDYYSGTVYAGPGLYALGYTEIFTDENGQQGYYEIIAMVASDDGVLGQVFVDSYYDRESRYTYTPVHAGSAVGDGYLGTERDYILFDGMVLNRFGMGPDGSTEVLYEADVTRSQAWANRMWEPLRTFQLNNLYRWYYFTYRLWGRPEFDY